jgi:type I restriction enzyme S subunit
VNNAIIKREKLIVMSIMTYYAKQIFDHTKKFEFRKSPLKESDLNKDIFIYSAKEDKAIIGTFKVSEIYHGNTEEILKLTGYDKRKDREEIVEYFGKNNPKCFALKLYDVKKLKRPISLKQLRKLNPQIMLPQYFSYIYPSDKVYDLLVESINL